MTTGAWRPFVTDPTIPADFLPRESEDVRRKMFEAALRTKANLRDAGYFEPMKEAERKRLHSIAKRLRAAGEAMSEFRGGEVSDRTRDAVHDLYRPDASWHTAEAEDFLQAFAPVIEQVANGQRKRVRGNPAVPLHILAAPIREAITALRLEAGSKVAIAIARDALKHAGVEREATQIREILSTRIHSV